MAKGFTLNVIFHGVIMFVERPTKEKSVTMLLCELDIVNRGTSYVRFDHRNYNQDSNPRQVDGTGNGQQHIELKHERLSFVDVADKKLTIDRSQDRISSTPTKVDATSLRWLTHLEELAPGHGRVQPGYFTIPPTGTPSLMARVDFSRGFLHTNGVERVQVPFQQGEQPAKRRPMARELVLELKFNGKYCELRSDPLDGSKHDPAKNMRFYANGANTINIHIGNEAFDDIYWETLPITPIDVVEKMAAKEYEFYYRLCATPPPVPRMLPRVASRAPGTTFCSVNGGGG